MWEELRNRKFLNLKFITAKRDPATIKNIIEAGKDNI